MSQKNPRRFTVDTAVFFPALILLFGAIAMVLTIPEEGSNPFAGLQAVIVDTASWFYVSIVTLIAGYRRLSFGISLWRHQAWA
jgi:choline-glycine betaine transporter